MTAHGVALALLLMVPALAPPATAMPLEFAWQRDGAARRQVIGAAPTALDPTLTTPLGSLWKLFVHAYLTVAGHPTAASDYTCTGGDPRQEGFCCVPGGRISADEALARSCGLSFAPARLGITPEAWRAHWAAQHPAPAAWLLDLDRMRPDTVVTVASLLDMLAGIQGGNRGASARALLAVVLDDAPTPARAVGGALRVKTWTWDHPERAGARVGGFAGWLADGTPVWARGDGAGISVLRRLTPALAAWLDANPVKPIETGCVTVELFARHPIREVTGADTGAPTPPGPLHGRHRVHFANGNELEIESHGEMTLWLDAGPPTLSAGLPLTEYVARVLDREAAAEPAHAARALAVVARTYLTQNGRHDDACYRIEDSSHAQRVAPRPATAAARAVAAWTDGIVLEGTAVTYHASDGRLNRLAWTEAVALARAGWTFDAILARAYPDARLAPIGAGPVSLCERLGLVERWLAARAPRWRARLAQEPGYEPPATVTACRLPHARPYADVGRARIWVRGLVSLDDRLTVAHEYLHLAFHRHPRGRDEAFVERLARELEMLP